MPRCCAEKVKQAEGTTPTMHMGDELTSVFTNHTTYFIWIYASPDAGVCMLTTSSATFNVPV